LTHDVAQKLQSDHGARLALHAMPLMLLQLRSEEDRAALEAQYSACEARKASSTNKFPSASTSCCAQISWQEL